MSDSCGCSGGADGRTLVRDGTERDRRAPDALDPAKAPVDDRRPEHAMVFASAYAEHLRYHGPDDVEDGTWRDFFASDLSARLAVPAVEDVTGYRTTVKALLRSLANPEPPASGTAMIVALGTVFDCLGTVARRLDALHRELPAAEPLRATVDNLIRSQLSPVLPRLIGYYLAGDSLGVVDRAAPASPGLRILGGPIETFESLVTGTGLSPEWSDGVAWGAFISVPIAAYVGAYGPGTTAVDQVNHLATHALFTEICDRFLAVYSRVVEEAGAALEASVARNGHQPHYALFLAFLRLLGHVREQVNGLTAAHRTFYYRDVLQLVERPAEPEHAHALVELAKRRDSREVPAGTRLKAGKDADGADRHFSVDRDLVANRATVEDLRRLYRHPGSAPLPLHHDRIFAATVDGDGQPWGPFAEKVHVDGALTSIAMPPAEVGFAVASHQLWLAEGTRRIGVEFRGRGLGARGSRKTGKRSKAKGAAKTIAVDLRCRLTTEDGWAEKLVDELRVTDTGLELRIELGGDDPPIVPYDPEVHGLGLSTSMPVLLVTLLHRNDAEWDYGTLERIDLSDVSVSVAVQGLKSVEVANDQGPVDPAKPFLPYGAAPRKGSALVVGSKEVFQKSPTSVTVHLGSSVDPVSDGATPTVTAEHLSGGAWQSLGGMSVPVTTKGVVLGRVPQPRVAEPDLTANAPYTTAARAGFVRLVLSAGFGTDTYPVTLAKWIAGGAKPPTPTAPVVPVIDALSVDYTAGQRLDLRDPSDGQGRYFHITPFGHAEQRRGSGGATVPMLPRFRSGSTPSEGELYIGVGELAPPQNLALLFQVVDGTADPLVVKPDDHIRWSYLSENEWVSFMADGVADGTDGLLNSGIVTLAVPGDATTEHTLLPAGMHWIRLSVGTGSDAVCRIVRIVAQALRATEVGPGTHTTQLPPGTIAKLDRPDPAIKGISQPFPTFGGRPVETPAAYAVRVSERLRHKDRAIALWDYEHLILEAFPGIHRARCLNHTRYEPTKDGTGIYRELAPGHVTVVTIPDRSGPDARDPLRPSTSLGLLGEIERFLAARTSCFATLHVRNPWFEEVRVDLRVRFRTGVDETFHVVRLKREITEFLSPWAFRNDARPRFNGRVRKSVLVDFIEERDYVDFVTDVQMFHRTANAESPDVEEIVGSRAVSVLVSAPAGRHEVRPIRPGELTPAEHCACAPAVPG